MSYLPRLAEADIRDWCIEVRPREKALESLEHLKVMLEKGQSPSYPVTLHLS